MWEIYKYGSVRGVMLSHIMFEIQNIKGETEMSTRQKQLLIGLLAISTFSTAVATNITPSQRLNNQLQQITDNYLKTAQEQKTGVTAIEASVLLPNEKNPRDFVAGLQQKNGAPATTDMMVQYGSITKASTASLVLKLVNEGTIKLSTTLYDIFPDKFDYNQWPEAWKQATVKQILNMTSGITEYMQPEITQHLNMYAAYSKEQIINMAAEYQKTKGCKAEYSCFPAGSSYGYSNTGYIIAGLIVEKYTHRDFQGEIYKTILEPLKQKTGANVHYI